MPKGSQVKSLKALWEYLAGWRWSSCVVHPLQAIVPKQQNIHQTGAARLELRVWEIISEGHILKLGETLGRKRRWKECQEEIRVESWDHSKDWWYLQQHGDAKAGWQMLRYRSTGGAQKVKFFYKRKDPQHTLFCRETCCNLRAFVELSESFGRAFVKPAFRELLESFRRACFQRAFGEPAFGELL